MSDLILEPEREEIAEDSTAKVSPADDVFDRTFKKMLDNFFEGGRPLFCPAERAWNPPTDIFETEDTIHIKMELAGVLEEDIEVKVSDNFLVVRGKRSDAQGLKKVNHHLMEIHYGRFERVFGLPVRMEVKNVSAALKNGFLLISIPKDARLREYRIKID